MLFLRHPDKLSGARLVVRIDEMQDIIQFETDRGTGPIGSFTGAFPPHTWQLLPLGHLVHERQTTVQDLFDVFRCE